jgi:hypothetical protein
MNPMDLYPIQNADAVSFVTGRTITGEQAILGVPGPFIAAVFFDSEGNYLRYEIRRPSTSLLLPGPQGRKAPRELLPHLWKMLDTWKTEIGYTPATITVASFFLPDLEVGIAKLPPHLHGYSEDPLSEPDKNLRGQLAEELAEWQRQQRFVLCWGNDYWMNRAGEVTDT